MLFSIWLPCRRSVGTVQRLDFIVVVASSSCTGYMRSAEARRLMKDISRLKDIVVLSRQKWGAD